MNLEIVFDEEFFGITLIWIIKNILSTILSIIKKDCILKRKKQKRLLWITMN